MPNKIDSNLTGLRIAEEETIGVLPTTPIWFPMEPNSYGEFGAQVSTTARNPINPSRQRRKGVVTDLDASAGFQNDFTQESLYFLMEGFFFADWREKANAAPSAVTGTAYTVGAGIGSLFAAGSLVWAEGFATLANNGLKVVTSNTSTTIVVSGLTAEASPPAGAKVTKVGVAGGAGDIGIVTSGTYPKATSTTLDFTTLGFIPGEWIFIGGDAAGDKFATAGDNGFVRIKSIAAHAIEFDRVSGVMAADDGALKTIRLFFGHVIKNESDRSLIIQRTYQAERSLGPAGYEYVKGCVANTLELKVTTADKVTVDFGFIGIDAEYRTTIEGAKTGTRPAVPDQAAFNSSSDFSRLRMIDDDTAATLFTYVTEFNLTINNNVTPSKAVGVLGAFDVAAGDFVAAGSLTAYFTTTDALNAVRNNDDVSFDFAIVKENAGWLFDIPYMSLSDGRLNVEKDTEIKLPVTMEGAEHPTLNHSLLAVSYTYLPTAAY